MDMNDNSTALQQSDHSAQNNSNQALLHTRDLGLLNNQSLPQGRRVTIGGMNRRSSLGMAEAALGDLFGRRASGFGELDILGRRGSMDSTSAVLDAAIMDLTRRRLSMAMGSIPPGEIGGMNEHFSPMNAMGGLGGMDLGSMNAMNMGNQLTSPLANQGGPLPASHPDPVSAINARQKQLQEQQRELERRQRELEIQRQQLVAAMEERRRAMQQMQQKMQLSQNNETELHRNSLGGLGGSSNQGLLVGLQNRGFPPPQPSNSNQWFVCKICNSKAFANREEAIQHEAICALERGRRSSLDLLAGTLDRPEFNRQNLATILPSASDRAQAQSQAKRDRSKGEADGGINRKISLSGGNGASSGDAHPTFLSSGPFSMMDEPLPLAMNSDKDWLTPLHCFVRRHCVEVFTASEKDVATPSKGKRKPIQVGQVGIRCPHCHHDESSKARERGSVYYPTTIASIYNATMNLLQRHLHNCSSVPEDIMGRYETLKADDARSGTSKKYWVESALSLGLVDTPNGIRFSALTPPPLPCLTSQQQSTGTFNTARRNSNDFFSSNSNAMGDFAQTACDDDGETKEGSAQATTKNLSQQETGKLPSGDMPQEDPVPETEQPEDSTPLVTPEDEPYATGFSYHLLIQMQPCVFTEADRLGKRKGLPPGFPGLACRHCFGGYGSGRFFPSSIKTLSDTSKTLNVLHNHMMRCRKCPQDIRENLDALRKTHDEQRAKMKFGSQKAFFARIWDRLHFKDPTVNSKRKFQPALSAGTGNQVIAGSSNQASAPAESFQQHGVDLVDIKYGMDATGNKRLKMS